MKEKHERYDKEDLELLTELKIMTPKNFHSYMHMFRNMDFLCAFLAGENNLVRKAWEAAVEHARRNEKVYTDHGETNEMFFCSTMYDLLGSKNYHSAVFTFLRDKTEK